MAGNLLAQKAAFIANELGLDPNLPLHELMAAAAKATGMALPKHTGTQFTEAEALRSTAQPQRDAQPAETARNCAACGQPARQLCAANGCCSRN